MKLGQAYILFLLLHLVFGTGAQQISYTISPYWKAKDTALLVSMTFKGNASGQTLIQVPYKDNGREQPQNYIKILKITNSTTYQVAANDSSQYILKHRPNAQLKVEYLIRNALTDAVPASDEVYDQMITANYFYLIGWDAWIVPADSSNQNFKITLNWKSFPKGWSHLNSYGANQLHQQINMSLSDFRHAIYMGGDMRVHTVKIKNSPLHLGIRGQWAFSDKELMDAISKTVTAQRAYWNDYDVPSYVVSIIPMKYTNDSDKSMNGRGLHNTFVTVGTNSKAFQISDLLFLYNHELMHHWIGNRLKQAQPENAYKWFHEGFTEYFAYIVMHEAGFYTTAEYKKAVNDILGNYYSDSTNQWPNERLEKEYWSSYSWQRLPYQRGLIFALYLDESIKKETEGRVSLKTILQEMLQEARQQGNIFNQDRFLALLQAKAGKDYRPALDAYITQGLFIPAKEWEKVTTAMALQSNEVFDLGFTTDKGKAEMNGVVNLIKEGSNAQQAGLQLGDKIIGYSFTRRSTDTATVVVKRGEEKIKFTYLPAGQVRVPQLQ